MEIKPAKKQCCFWVCVFEDPWCNLVGFRKQRFLKCVLINMKRPRNMVVMISG